MSNLTACERLELIRHKDRPTVNDYIPAMFTGSWSSTATGFTATTLL